MAKNNPEQPACVDASAPPKIPPCTKCGKDVPHQNYLGGNDPRSEINRMKRDGLCFGCAFWSLKTERKNPLVIKGVMYAYSHSRPMSDDAPSRRGFGGLPFDIEWFDGRLVTTNNLWCNGTIPAIWRDRLPDTARFLPSGGASLRVHTQTEDEGPVLNTNTVNPAGQGGRR